MQNSALAAERRGRSVVIACGFWVEWRARTACLLCTVSISLLCLGSTLEWFVLWRGRPPRPRRRLCSSTHGSWRPLQRGGRGPFPALSLRLCCSNGTPSPLLPRAHRRDMEGKRERGGALYVKAERERREEGGKKRGSFSSAVVDEAAVFAGGGSNKWWWQK